MGGSIMHAISLKIGRLFAVTTAILSAWLLTASAPLHAQSGDSGFSAYVQSLWPKAQARGVSRQVFDRVTAGLRYNPRVIALDRDNLGSPPTHDTPIPNFAPYKAKHVDAARIGGGRRVHDRLLPLLSRIEARTGVPTSIMIAIYGHETAYGQVTGNFDLPEALATLAYEGRRRSLFEPEFLATLEMVQRGVPREVLKGSWAGDWNETGRPRVCAWSPICPPLPCPEDGRRWLSDNRHWRETCMGLVRSLCVFHTHVRV